eukprot:m51a1_g4176 hypothetical protein (123) ;mRNA; r:345333-347360
MSSDDDRARPPAAKRRRMDESIFIHVSGGNSVINNYFVAGLDGLPLAMVPAVPAGPQPAVPAVPAVPAAVPAAVPVAVPVVPAAHSDPGRQAVALRMMLISVAVPGLPASAVKKAECVTTDS